MDKVTWEGAIAVTQSKGEILLELPPLESGHIMEIALPIKASTPFHQVNFTACKTFLFPFF